MVLLEAEAAAPSVEVEDIDEALSKPVKCVNYKFRQWLGVSRNSRNFDQTPIHTLCIKKRKTLKIQYCTHCKINKRLYPPSC